MNRYPADLAALSDDEDTREGPGHGVGPEGEQLRVQEGGADDVDDSIHAFQGHTDAIYAVAFDRHAASSDVVATGGSDDMAFVWRVGEDAFMENQGEVFELRGHTDTITSIQFAMTESGLVATGGMDGTVRVWSGKDRYKQLHVLDGPSESIEWIQWHPRGDIILAGSTDFSAWMWNGLSGECMASFMGHAGPVSCGSFTPDGKAVVTCGGEGDATLKVWDPRSGVCVTSVEGAHFHTTGITCMAIHPNGQTALSGSEAGAIKLASLENGKVLGSLDRHVDGLSVEGIVYLPGGQLVASAGMDGNLVVWDLASCSPRVECQHPDGITRVVAHPTNHMLITGGLDGVVRCWDCRSGGLEVEFRGHTDAIQDMDLSVDGWQILTGGEDGCARVFDLRQLPL
jgi:WD40 repeat protein